MLKKFSTSLRAIAFYPELAKIIGIHEALFVQHLYFWSESGRQEDGFIYKDIVELENDTALSYKKQRTVRQSLIKKGLLEEKKKRVDGKDIIHFKLNVEMIDKLLENLDNPKKLIVEILEQKTSEKKKKETAISIITEEGQNPDGSFGDLEINECYQYFAFRLEGIPDNLPKDRWYAKHLLNFLKKHYPDKDPVKGVKVLIDLAVQDDFHSKNATSFKYLYYHRQQFIQSYKQKSKNRQKNTTLVI